MHLVETLRAELKISCFNKHFQASSLIEGSDTNIECDTSDAVDDDDEHRMKNEGKMRLVAMRLHLLYTTNKQIKHTFSTCEIDFRFNTFSVISSLVCKKID